MKKSQKSKVKSQKFWKGYTFIELLAVISLFAIVGTAIVVILMTTFRGSKKSELLIDLRASGKYMLTQMENNIRYAESLDDPGACVAPVTTDSVTITSLRDGGQTTYACPQTGVSGIASNGALLMDSDAIVVTSCSFTCAQESSYDPPTITIQFTLEQSETSNFVESTASIPFETSVTMRNLIR